jgi:hypothetical protein
MFSIRFRIKSGMTILFLLPFVEKGDLTVVKKWFIMVKDGEIG